LLYAVLAAGTAFAGVRPGHVLGLEGVCLGTVFSEALLKHAGWGVCGAVVRPSSGVRAGGRVAGPGPRQPAGARRNAARPGTPCCSGTADREWPRRTECRTTHL